MDEQKLADAMTNVVSMIRPNVKPDDALKFAQAFLYLVQGHNGLEATKKKTATKS